MAQLAASRIEVRHPGVVVTLERREFLEEEVIDAEEDHLLSLTSARPRAGTAIRYRGPAFVTDYHPLGPITLLPAGLQGCARGPTASTRLLLCRFDSMAFEPVLGGLRALDRSALRGCADLRQSVVSGLMWRLVQELLVPGFASDLMIQSLAGQIAAELARRMPGGRQPAATPPGALSAALIEEVHDYVVEQLAGRLSLADAARRCAMPARQFARAFQAATGRHFADYVTAIRLATAQRLLAHSHLPIKEIGFRVGFSHVSSFTAAFGRETGQTPKAFRSRHGR